MLRETSIPEGSTGSFDDNSSRDDHDGLGVADRDLDGILAAERDSRNVRNLFQVYQTTAFLRHKYRTFVQFIQSTWERSEGPSGAMKAAHAPTE